jgi:hypothetical protein
VIARSVVPQSVAYSQSGPSALGDADNTQLPQ